MKILGYTLEQVAWIGVRLALGWTMLWAFLDKTFGLGFRTSVNASWLAGGSPTNYYLGQLTSGIFTDFYHGLAGNAVVDVIFMVALLAISVALILGIGMKIAGYTGAILMILLWSTNVPPTDNPIIDDHIIYAILFLALTVVKAGQWIGLGKWWITTPFVKKIPLLE